MKLFSERKYWKVIRRARYYLDMPEKWIQGAWAKNEYGEEVSPFARDAIRFCMDGALLLATSDFLKTRREGRRGLLMLPQKSVPNLSSEEQDLHGVRLEHEERTLFYNIKDFLRERNGGVDTFIYNDAKDCTHEKVMFYLRD